MGTSGKITTRRDTKVLLSTLWIVVMINMLTADILSLFIPGIFDEMLAFAGGTPIPVLMLGSAVIMELSIAMIFLSRVLRHAVNRWANIVVGILTMAFVVFGGSSYPHYVFLATVEVVCLLAIIWYAWKWSTPEG
jgi:hypothetical protein